MSEVYNLDENVNESFNFKLMGHTYVFRQPTSEEMEEFKKKGEDENSIMEYLFKFITPLDKAPEFSVIYKKMIAPQIRNFIEMVKAELNMTKS